MCRGLSRRVLDGFVEVGEFIGGWWDRVTGWRNIGPFGCRKVEAEGVVESGSSIETLSNYCKYTYLVTVIWEKDSREKRSQLVVLRKYIKRRDI